MGNRPSKKDKKEIKRTRDIMSSQVQIKKNLQKNLPFHQIKSRLATATVLSYVDFKEEVILMVLKLSHQTRAYLHNEGGLQGFLVQEPLVQIIIREGLDKVQQWQNCRNLRKDLNLRRKLTLEGRIDFLKQNYPAAALMVLQCLDKEIEAEVYMKNCKKAERDVRNYSYYVHGYLLPWLQKQRSEGNLSKGNSSYRAKFVHRFKNNTKAQQIRQTLLDHLHWRVR